jgi:membrane associated rhomboid family serine protease
MTTSFDSPTSREKRNGVLRAPNWLKVAAVAAVSAFAGGLAAAWWHRKTLAKLRESEENPKNPDFGISGTDPIDEL